MLMSISAALYGDFLVFFLRFHLFIFREGEEKKEEKKRNISVKEKHKSVPSHTHPDWGLKHNPGMWPDRTKQANFHVARQLPTNRATLVRAPTKIFETLFSLLFLPNIYSVISL